MFCVEFMGNCSEFMSIGISSNTDEIEVLTEVTEDFKSAFANGSGGTE